MNQTERKQIMENKNSNLKINIDQLKNYLGTGLKLLFIRDEEFEMEGYIPGLITNVDKEYGQNGRINTNYYNIDKSRPICYRLSNLDKFIPELGFVPLNELYFEAGHQRSAQNNGGMMLWKKSMFETILHALPSELSYGVISKLFQWHFWPFGNDYFEAGLVIDKLKHETK